MYVVKLKYIRLKVVLQGDYYWRLREKDYIMHNRKRLYRTSFIVLSILMLMLLWNIGVHKLSGSVKGLLSRIEFITYDWRAQLATDKGPFKNIANAQSNIILLTADDYTSEILSYNRDLNIGRWPWPRRVWGNVVNYISKGKPKIIIFDIKFENKEGISKINEDSDRFFAEAVKKSNVIIGIAVYAHRLDLFKNKKSNENNNYKYSSVQSKLAKILSKYNNKQIDQIIIQSLGFNTKAPKNRDLFLTIDDKLLIESDDKDVKSLLDNISFYSYSSIYDELINNVSRVGVINLEQGENMIARYHIPLYRLVTSDKTYYVPSLPMAAALSLIGEQEKKNIKILKNKIIVGRREIPIDDKGRFLINWHGKAGTYPTHSIGKILLSDAYDKKIINKINKNDYIPPEAFKDKIIVIGQTSAGTDLHPTPMDMIYPGPEIITTVIDNLLNDTDLLNPVSRKFVTPAPFSLNLAVVILFCFLVGYFNIKTKNYFLSLVWFFLILLSFLFLSILAFIHPEVRIWLNMTYPTIFITFTAITTYLFKMNLEKSAKQEVEGLFGKFVSPQVLEKLLKDPKCISSDGQRKNMSVIFSDIRNFTTLTESTPVRELIPQLNEYLTEMVEVILKYNGTLDKFMGDAIMAFYGDPLYLKDHALLSVITAIDMQDTLEKLNKKWEANGQRSIKVGIGINSGDMIVGQIGSHRLIDYTVIGDNVNIAQRVEKLTKDYNVKIIITEATYSHVSEFVNVNYIGEKILKGRQEPIKIFEVTSLNEKGIQVQQSINLNYKAK